MAEGRGFVHSWAHWDPVYDNGTLPTPTTLWPPGYSLAIALLVSQGFGAVLSGRLISAAAFVLLPIPVYCLFRYLLPSGRALAGTCVVMTLTALVPLAAAVATEMPFVFLASCSVLFTLHAQGSQSPRETLIYTMLASLAAGGAFLFRYVGVACLLGVVLGVTSANWSRGKRVPFVAAMLGIAPGGAIVLLVALRNWLLMDTPGQPMPKGTVFWPTLGRSLRGVVGAIIGPKELLGPHLSFLRALELALLLAIISFAVASFARAALPGRERQVDQEAIRATAVIAVFSALSAGCTFGALAKWGGQVLEPRYVVVYLPWAAVLVLGWALRVDLSGGRRRPMVLVATKAVCALWILCQTLVTLRAFSCPRSDDYISAGRTSPAIAWVKAHVPPSEIILTNRGADIAFWCPNPVLRLPRLPHSAKGVTSWEGVDHLAVRVNARYLIHFVGYPKDAKYDAREFAFIRSLDTSDDAHSRWSVRLTDAVVYEVGRSQRSGPERAHSPGAVAGR